MKEIAYKGQSLIKGNSLLREIPVYGEIHYECKQLYYKGHPLGEGEIPYKENSLIMGNPLQGKIPYKGLPL